MASQSRPWSDEYPKAPRSSSTIALITDAADAPMMSPAADATMAEAILFATPGCLVLICRRLADIDCSGYRSAIRSRHIRLHSALFFLSTRRVEAYANHRKSDCCCPVHRAQR